MAKIKNIRAIEILDSRGKPTLRTFVFLDDGTVASSSIPSGASTGSHEAVELRDNDSKRYHGLGVLKAVNNVNEIIAKKLVGQPLDKLDELDKLMIDLDGSENKSVLGANAILSVSQALIKAAAQSLKKPLWQFINEYYFEAKPRFPRMMFNVINGGKHADWNFDIQEFIIIPQRQLASESIKVGSEIYHSIQKNLKEKKLSILVGDEGGFSPILNSNEEAFQLIIESAKNIGYENGKDFKLAIDGAASEFFSNGKYILKKDNKEITGDELIKYYLEIENKYGIYSFEDVFQEDDWENWTKFKTQLNQNELLVGDDLFCTNTKRMGIGFEKKSANATIIKPNQIGTIKETVDAIKLAKQYNWLVAVSHRSGETEDSFIADLAYAAGADFLKTGSLSRSERLAKYNRLIEIENNL
ncbi:phosphopyruvate hydratase [Candidatus Roizmanbacteria bacterium]|nr:phosphopyruvate hydratase [Candidatus Roizmanbacteria bacterium]